MPALLPASSPDASEPPSLRQKVYKGVGWSALASLLTQGLNLVRLYVLTRLLPQADLGLSVMLLTAVGALSLLTNVGMGAVVVTKKFRDEAEMHVYLNTCWTFDIARSAVLSLLLMGASLPVARWFGQPALAPLLVATSAIPFVFAFNNVGLMLLRRDVNIARMTQFELCCAFATVGCSLFFAWLLRSVWGLVLGNFVFTLIAIALSYRFHPYRPRFQFDKLAFKDGFRFGQAVFVAGLMAFIATNADNMVVGKTLGPIVLAVYATAFGASTLPQKLISGLLGQVLFPSFAAVGREGGERVEAIVHRAFVLGAALVVLLVTPMFLLSNEVVRILYDPRYWGAGPLLAIMLVGGVFRSLSQILGPLVHGLGRPEIDAKASTVEAFVFVALLSVLTSRLGAPGAAWAGVTAYALSFVLRALWSVPLAPRAMRQLPATLLLALLCAGGGWGAGMGVLQLPFLEAASVWLRAIAGATVCLGVASLLLAILFPSLSDEAAKIVGMVRKRA